MGLLWLEPKLSLFGYFDEKGKVELNYAGHINRTDKLSFTYMQKEWNFSHVPVTEVGTDVAKLSMEGSAEIGLKPQIDFSLCGRQAGFGMNAQVGLKEYINFVFDATRLSDGGLYESMRDSYCRTTIPWSVSVHANANIFSRYDAGHSDSGPATYSYTFSPAREPQWGEDRYIFPVFENVSAKRQKGDQTKAEAKSSVLRTPLLPLKLGFSVLDQDGNVINSQYDSRTYEAGNLFEAFTTELTGLQSGEKYKVRPTIKMMGYDISASPVAEIEEVGETSCPDSNHPHWIDMGLPSGTQWRCCNEGASTPEAYGGYYTFGQVASAPSRDQIKELLNYCTSVWTTQNGVNGRKFTGPNGGTIFLPAAGYLWNGELYDVGSDGYYWSSTPGDADGAYRLLFGSYDAYWGGWYDREYGRSVRPVR